MWPPVVRAEKAAWTQPESSTTTRTDNYEHVTTVTLDVTGHRNAARTWLSGLRPTRRRSIMAIATAPGWIEVGA